MAEVFFLTIRSKQKFETKKQKIEIKTRNTAALSYHLKVGSTQNKGIAISSSIFMFGYSQSFPNNSYQAVLVDVERLHKNGK